MILFTVVFTAIISMFWAVESAHLSQTNKSKIGSAFTTPRHCSFSTRSPIVTPQITVLPKSNTLPTYAINNNNNNIDNNIGNNDNDEQKQPQNESNNSPQPAAQKKAAVVVEGVEEAKQQKEVVVRLGSGEYYSGFVSRGVGEEPTERVTGDAVLIPTLKFAGGFAALVGVLLLAFLASNGLL